MKIKRWTTISKTALSLLLLSACNSDDEIIEQDNEYQVDKTDKIDDSTSTDRYPYTEAELEADPSAPSTSPDDYNPDGEYVPESGPTNNPADYNSDGDYEPLEDMTQEEIQQELESMLGESFGQ